MSDPQLSVADQRYGISLNSAATVKVPSNAEVVEKLHFLKDD